MEEAGATLPPLAGFDLPGYKAQLLRRFANPLLRHRTAQIAMDGSQKLPQRLLAPARERLARGAPIPFIALGVAAWMRFVTGIGEDGRPLAVQDPLAAELKARAEAAGLDAARLAPALLGVRAVFGDDLPAHPGFARPVEAALAELIRSGAAATAADYRG